MNVNIQVFVPAYTCEAWLERCLNSIKVQEYPHVSLVMVDDASTDSTGKIMDAYAQEKWAEVIHNRTNMRMPYNLTYLRDLGERQDVIFIVDGDDYLPHEYVLTEVARCFQDSSMWLMYGSYTRFPDPSFMPNPAKPFPPDVIARNDYRAYSSHDLVYNHPLVFRRWLFNHISNSELQDDAGVWFNSAYDHSIMMPMLELAGDGHFMWNPEILYVYNEENMFSEAKSDKRMEGVRVHHIVNSRPKRTPIAP